uniref:Uncharacterized protein n=1 Tax=Hyaloperonospora arabidopsidis (strain Emoy2) TaxID=559515 RepID=M4BVK4_HYAAE
MGLEELAVTGIYVSGAVCIVLLTLSISWLVVWKCVLSKMPFIQELFDLTPKKPSTLDAKSISFQDRYQAYKRVEAACNPDLLGGHRDRGREMSAKHNNERGNAYKKRAHVPALGSMCCVQKPVFLNGFMFVSSSQRKRREKVVVE